MATEKAEQTEQGWGEWLMGLSRRTVEQGVGIVLDSARPSADQSGFIQSPQPLTQTQADAKAPPAAAPQSDIMAQLAANSRVILYGSLALLAVAVVLQLSKE